MNATRPIAAGDARAVTELFNANREFLEPWMPRRADDFFTVEHQSALIDQAVAQAEEGTNVQHVILDDGEIGGLIKLSGVTRGAFQSASLGYWVDGARNGRGLASAAVAAMIEVAFGELGLHRVQAEILAHNNGSRRVLERNGFVRYGVAPEYLHIDGRWQDHVLYQVLNDDWKG